MPNLRPFITHYLKLTLLIASLLLIYQLAVFLAHQSYMTTDFRAFFASAQILKNQPQNFYNPDTQFEYQKRLIPIDSTADYLPVFNPPHYVIPLLFLTHLPPQQTYQITITTLAIIHITAIYFLTKYSQVTNLTLALFAIAAMPAYSSIALTQSSVLTLLIFILTSLYFKQKKYLFTGLIASLLTYKPQLAIVLFPFLLLQRNKSLTTGLIIGISISAILSYLLLGNELFDVIALITNFRFTNGTSHEGLISLTRLFEQLKLPTIIAIPLSFLPTFHFLATSRHQPLSFYQLSLISLTTLLSGIHIHYHESVLLLIPIYYLIKQPTWKPKALALTTAIMFSLNHILTVPFSLLSNPQICIILSIYLYLIHHRPKQPNA